jgi:hypothetical protein
MHTESSQQEFLQRAAAELITATEAITKEPAFRPSDVVQLAKALEEFARCFIEKT